MALLVLLHAALTVAWLGSCVVLLSKAGPLLRGPRVGGALGRTTGVVLIGSGLVVAASSG
ncbi:hypothetical protein [Streptomyces sp. NPDC048191]|uniref:hypothetical protein n=1 Tax=Streptomyces sp. NPDC048191 TaxID=3155484 RepID=UPI0033F49523